MTTITIDLLNQAYERGWIEAACWAKRDDLCADVGSPAYIADREAHLDALREALQAKQDSLEFINPIADAVAKKMQAKPEGCASELADALRLLRVAIQTGGPEYDARDWIDMIDTALNDAHDKPE